LGTTGLFRWNRLQWSVLLLSLALLSAQTIAQQHIHALDAPAESCVVCAHGDAPAVAAAAAACAVTPPAAGQREIVRPQRACEASSTPYLTRAPPKPDPTLTIVVY